MSDDETQRIPVDETVREPDMDLPTEALPQSQPAYGGEPYGNAGYENAHYGNAGYGNAGYENTHYGNAGYGGEIIRPSGVSKATVVFGVFVGIIGLVSILCGLSLPMEMWWSGIEAQRFLIYVFGGIGVLLIAVAAVWAIVGAVRARKTSDVGIDRETGTDASANNGSAEQSPERQ